MKRFPFPLKHETPLYLAPMAGVSESPFRRLCRRFGADVFATEFIDINFGCPVKKVVKRNGGSGCLKDLGLVQDVIRAVARNTSLPVTCKIRSGWNEEMRDPV